MNQICSTYSTARETGDLRQVTTDRRKETGETGERKWETTELETGDRIREKAVQCPTMPIA